MGGVDGVHWPTSSDVGDAAWFFAEALRKSRRQHTIFDAGKRKRTLGSGGKEEENGEIGAPNDCAMAIFSWTQWCWRTIENVFF